jgi:hypothetical protein
VAVHVPVPRQLPVDASAFVGRERELAELDRLGADLSVVVLSGFAGVGKTALALRWARTLAGDFPDGQLYLDLRGYSADRPLSAVEAQTRLLAPFGVPAARVPADPRESTALFRSVLADRRVLVMLDNALSAEQVRRRLGSRNLTDACGRAGREQHDAAPVPVLTVGTGHESGSEPGQRHPVGQCERTRVVQLVLSALVHALPAGGACRVSGPSVRPARPAPSLAPGPRASS